MRGVLSLVLLASASPTLAADQLALVRDGAVYLGGTRVAAGSAPAVSRDGAWVAFVSARDGNPELYVARPGRPPVRLSYTPGAAESAPDWSPDGKRLVYASGGDLHVTTLDRARTRLLVRRGAAPAWSPDGRLVAFERDGDLWLVTASGAGARRLTRNGATPTWAPDGRRLAHERDGDVSVTALASGRTKLLLRRGSEPSWSPDGRRIAFERERAAWAVSADGARQAWLRAGTDPDWRPRPAVRELLPDLDQQPPSNLTVITAERRGSARYLLGFDSKAGLLPPRPTTALRANGGLHRGLRRG